MASSLRAWAAAAAVASGLLVTAACTLAVPLQPFRVAAELLAELFHLACAFVAGAALVRLPRAAPRETLDLVVTCTVLGLALISLLTLLAASAGLVSAWVPWAVDVVALLVGAGRLGAVVQSVRDAWSTLDLSFVPASRIPLFAALAAVSLLHLVPPFIPATAEAGTEQLALPTQAGVRGSLPEALTALPGSLVRPSTGLLLHGQLATGHDGARLHGLALVALLAGAVFLHARRHLGGRAAAWATLCLATMPALLDLDARDASQAFLALLAFLAFHEVADWSARATGGKIALASTYGGLAVAESAAGASAWLAVLAFLFVVEAFIERHGLLRQLQGILGMILVSLVAAAPFVLTAAWLHRDGPVEHVVERVSEGAEGAVVPWARAPWHGADTLADLTARAADAALALGPLAIGLLLLAPLLPEAPEGVRRAVLAGLLALALWALPPPWSSAALALPLAAVVAGATARGLTALGGVPGAATALLVVVAGPVTLLAGVTRGPDVFHGAAVMAGTTSRGEYLARHLDDDLLVRAVHDAGGRSTRVLLVGSSSLAHYRVPVLRWPVAAELSNPVALVKALRTGEVTHVAVDHSAPDTPPRGTFELLVPLLDEADPLQLYRVPAPSELDLQPAQGPGEAQPPPPDD